jgi:hypothetical protein
MLNLEVWHIVLTAIVLLFLGGFVGGRIAILSSLIRTSGDVRHDVSVSLDQVADRMAEHPPHQWAGWIIHLLKALEGRAGDDEYRATLKTIRDSLTGRLESGQWPTKHL